MATSEALFLLMAWGLWRLSHLDAYSTHEWGVFIEHSRRPDSDTFSNYCHKLIELDESNSSCEVAERGGLVVPYGFIEQPQLNSLVHWVQAGLVSCQKIGVNRTQTRQVLETCWVFPRIIKDVLGLTL